eukprot:TRINITY_DN7513_c0_g1_i1.p1 TRINITY_DN7513_c0_g1~~TRINITY_DN7513_c0_g1_i1.p1  ORF type:complete len:482 (+),score=149.02 TRINITY_DN7513_c0_g1_i1:128-1573(+)
MFVSAMMGQPAPITSAPSLQPTSFGSIPVASGGNLFGQSAANPHKLKYNEFPCCVERAKSGRSKCNGCKKDINQGNVRIGQQWNMDHSGNLWYHLFCFRNWPKEPIVAKDFFFGYERMDPKGQEKVDTRTKQIYAKRAGNVVVEEEEEDLSEDDEEGGSEDDNEFSEDGSESDESSEEEEEEKPMKKAMKMPAKKAPAKKLPAKKEPLPKKQPKLKKMPASKPLAVAAAPRAIPSSLFAVPAQPQTIADAFGSSAVRLTSNSFGSLATVPAAPMSQPSSLFGSPIKPQTTAAVNPFGSPTTQTTAVNPFGSPSFSFNQGTQSPGLSQPLPSFSSLFGTLPTVVPHNFSLQPTPATLSPFGSPQAPASQPFSFGFNQASPSVNTPKQSLFGSLKTNETTMGISPFTAQSLKPALGLNQVLDQLKGKIDQSLAEWIQFVAPPIAATLIDAAIEVYGYTKDANDLIDSFQRIQTHYNAKIAFSL